MTAIRTFLARAVPWPSATQPGFVNIHWTARDKATRAKRGLGGRAFTDHNQASNYAQWLVGTNTDIYVCMSLQAFAEDGLNSKGKPIKKAMRDAFAALLLRSFWIDIDVKPGAFATTVEAKQAFDAWRIKVGLPEPTFIVLTGSGGFHVHWVLDDPVSRETWLPLAHALQNALKVHQFPCDYGVIINPACILRVPDTQNFKDLAHVTDTKLDQSLQHTYSLDVIEKALEPYKVSYVLPVSTPTQKRLGFTPNPKLAVLRNGPRLDAGIEAYVPTIDDVADACPWIDATLNHGGQGYSEPLWFESLKVASFVVDGEEVAHELSWGHVGYDEAATEQKYEQVAGTHGGGRIGWPQCRTINAAGAMECATCPHFLHDRSPLNYATPPAPPAAAPQPQPAVTPAQSPIVAALRAPNHALPNYGFGDLPKDGYKYTPDGVIHEEIEVEIDDPASPGKKIMAKAWDPVLPMPIFDLDNYRRAPDGQGAHGVSFVCQTDAVHFDEVHLKLEDIGDLRRLTSMCGQQGVAVTEPGKLKRLAMSFRQLLRSRALSAKNSEGFGWSTKDDAGEPDGFCYAKTRFSASGISTFTPVSPSLSHLYQPSGSLDYWKQAAKLITDQERPDLNSIIAASLAAPLVIWTGQPGIVLSAFSNASGIGKSHAMRIAQAIWGNPATGMSTLNDTPAYVGMRVALLRHLPFFYDELRQEADTKKIVELVFNMAQGKSKGRLTSSAEAREVHAFSTLMTIASNTSLMSYINEHVKTTTAGINRIFEMEIASAPGAPGMIDPTVAQKVNGGLNGHYGHPGAVYAHFLGTNLTAVRDAVGRAAESINNHVKGTHDERFWVTMLAVLTMGAKYGNHLGLTTIDDNKMLGYLIERFHQNRAYRKGSTVGLDDPSNALIYLQDYVNAHREGTLVTDHVWTQTGRPPATYKPLILNSNGRFDGKLVIRRAMTDKVLRISIADFGSWLKKDRGVSRDLVIDALIKSAGAVRSKTIIGSNTNYAAAREHTLEFDLTKLPDLFD